MSVFGRHLLLLGMILAFEIGCAQAQDYESGKSGPQLFAKNCSSCHHSPRGLARDRSGGSLAEFLRQHYTSSPASARELTGYLLSLNGPARRGAQRRGSASPLRPPAGVPKH